MSGVDSRMYPIGSGQPKARPIQGTWVDFGGAKVQRTRLTTAQVNAGFTLLPALPGVKWRILDMTLIALGGNASGATSVNIIGTSAGSAVQLLAAAVAALTRSTVCRAGDSNVAVLADGASFLAMDANTAITIDNVGSALATSTGVDVFLTFTADPVT